MNAARLLCALLLVVAALPVAASPEHPAPRPEIVSRDDWGATPAEYPDGLRHTPKVVLIHHAGVVFEPDADPAAKMRGLLRFSREDKGWPDVPYHFVVAPDGRVFEGRDMSYAPDTNTNFDTSGFVNVEVLGHFDEQRVSEVQLESTARVVAWLADELEMPTNELQTHVGVAPGQTSLPGGRPAPLPEGGTLPGRRRHGAGRSAGGDRGAAGVARRPDRLRRGRTGG